MNISGFITAALAVFILLCSPGCRSSDSGNTSEVDKNNQSEQEAVISEINKTEEEIASIEREISELDKDLADIEKTSESEVPEEDRN